MNQCVTLVDSDDEVDEGIYPDFMNDKVVVGRVVDARFQRVIDPLRAGPHGPQAQCHALRTTDRDRAQVADRGREGDRACAGLHRRGKYHEARRRGSNRCHLHAFDAGNTDSMAELESVAVENSQARGGLGDERRIRRRIDVHVERTQAVAVTSGST